MTSRFRARVSNFRRLAAALPFALGTLALAGAGCQTTTHGAHATALGQDIGYAQAVEHLDENGPIQFTRIVSADWQVDLSGLVNLDHPKAKAAGLTDHLEPIQIYFDVIRHPTKGTFLIDSGMDKALRDDPDNAVLRGLVAKVMKRELLDIRMPLGQWLKESGEKVQGVWLTHMHPDHIAGIADLPDATRIYSGPGEAGHREFLNMFVQRTINRALDGKPEIEEWNFSGTSQSSELAVIDIFGDQSAFAISVPGHTVGSVAYLLRTTSGPVLVVGDTSHTKWGWENQVEPGSFTHDHERNQASLAALRKLVQTYPNIAVYLGHQPLAN